MTDTQARFAQTLFDGIAPAYDTPAEVFSFGQYGRWRRRAVSRMRCPPGGLVLDVATGTGLVARDLLRRRFVVAGLDQSVGMLRRARSREPRYPLVAGSARKLPAANETFDGLAFTYLLRYVPDPAETVREMVRVLKPGGSMVSVEFGLPSRSILRRLWNLYSLRVLPMMARLISPGWRLVGDFLGPNIVEWINRYPPETVAQWWRDAGMTDVRIERMSFGAGVVISGVKR